MTATLPDLISVGATLNTGLIPATFSSGGVRNINPQPVLLYGPNGNPLLVQPDGSLPVMAGTPKLYRSAVVAADVGSAPGALTTSVVAGGSLVDATPYLSKVVAGNALGRTTATAGTTRTTASPSLTLRIAIPQVTGATYYDVYVSVDADPKWVGRITEAQRASGILITAVGVTGAGGIAGAVDVQVAGTGLLAGTTAAVNTMYILPAQPTVMPIVCTGKQYCDFDLVCSRTGDAVAPALVVLPVFDNSVLANSVGYVPATTLTFGGTTGNYQPLFQRIRVECRGNDALSLLVESIAGTGMSVDMYATLS